MGRCIIKIKGKYFLWSTVVDAPISYGMTLNELKDYVGGEYGVQGLRHLKERLKKVEKHGTSMIDDASLEDTISLNRAGDNESEITADEIYEKYTLRNTLSGVI
jgi:hypothetical protein